MAGNALVNVYFAFATATTPPGLGDKIKESFAPVGGATSVSAPVAAGDDQKAYKVSGTSQLSQAQLFAVGRIIAEKTGCQLRGARESTSHDDPAIMLICR